MPAIHVQSVTSYGKCRWADGGLSASSSPNWVVHPITKSHACGSKRLNACCSNQTLTCLRLPPSAVLQKQRAFTSISAGSPAPHPPPTEERLAPVNGIHRRGCRGGRWGVQLGAWC